MTSTRGNCVGRRGEVTQVNNEGTEHVQVFGQPGGDLLVKSKFSREGVLRSFDDFEWTLKTFEFENPTVGVIGQFVRSYFGERKEVKYFEERRLVKLMLGLMQKRRQNRPGQSLVDLKLSITSGNKRESDSKLEEISKKEGREWLDESLREEPSDSGERR